MAKHKGFTFVEITLFLAITAMLFIGVVASVQNLITRQRFDDTVQNFYGFMQSIYSSVSNPQSLGEGNSDVAVYGKLVVFGEKVDLQWNELSVDKRNRVFVYDVIGNVKGNTASYLGGITPTNPVVLQWKKDPSTGERTANKIGVEPFYMEEYMPRWNATIQNIAGGSFVGSILVIRHPDTGTINTLFLNGTAIEVNETMKTINNGIGSANYSSTVKNLLKSHLSNSSSTPFVLEEVNFCVSPYEVGTTGSGDRVNIRLAKNARNASGVQMIDMNGDDNYCNK